MHQLLFDYISKYMPLTSEEKNVILELNLFREIKKGTLLLEEGQQSDLGYFVLKGCIRKYYIIDGEEKTTNFYTELQGEVPECAINKKPSSYYLSCIEDSIISASTSELDDEMFARFPRFETLCRIISEELLQKSQSSLDNFKYSPPAKRYENLVATRPDLIQRVPQHQLASFLGITPQSLSRLKARLQKTKRN
ncbi:Crp/Fnr family transcriptional regulator [Cyclobacterium marinum]|uniref:Putative transcriptional regulator, Crp/Fnr family n=1 Tax=Cyclobacterium marinum (strain ATCC 25205 / DSM 745 / LMG 13164 / NCIMB 1802) TaxID=880070 RepID=G0J789_CYCMS|nr:Crp/Fnr family transcriptional regulator [Cyclobacterium marinum]AEL27722.1 putative transcriptional regulator, Crp/Fnr family [Cyclobacterium marinum DSM 745]MBI0397487.1 Crp/Fnr family transcriptional regulator [Cyclobacterium marinum]MBR9774185.1 Crp/Fnr family transcriptional regulator [Cytophagales bacterium]|tara:strand:+ start:86605 stop:87186 length:582 start_codon:yes stop_codon:yes gene_type:complete